MEGREVVENRERMEDGGVKSRNGVERGVDRGWKVKKRLLSECWGRV